MRLALWPRGLIGRVGLVLFAAVLLEIIGSTVVFEQAEIVSGDESQALRIADQLEAASRVLAVTPAESRVMVAKTLSISDLTLAWEQADRRRVESDGSARSRDLIKDMVKTEPGLGARDLHVRATAGTARGAFDGDLRMPDGSVLRFQVSNLPSTVPKIYAQLWSVAILSACVLLAALLIVRTLAAPLAMLVKATDAIGHGPSVQLAVSGPDEVRRVATAFNAMHDRIATLIRNRTDALAAVSHDLRTPIQRMRLRAGFLRNADDKRAFEADLTEMESMVNDLLHYLGGDSDPEKPKRTDLVAMLTTLVDDAADAGHVASYDGPERLALVVRPVGFKRAVSNVVNNAIAYGGCARVSLRADDKNAIVSVSDDGPGIPEDAFATVFEPFQRLETSRNRGTGGTGLGLTITRQAVGREGGRIGLANRPEGGLTVTITVPMRAGQAAALPMSATASPRHTLLQTERTDERRGL